MNKVISRHNTDTASEYAHLKAYDRVKESAGRKPKAVRKGGNRRADNWRDLVDEVEDEPVVVEVVEEEPEDWFYYTADTSDQGFEITNSPKIPYTVGVAMILLNGFPRSIVYAIIDNECVVLDTFVNEDILEEEFNLISKMPNSQQLNMARTWLEAQWWDQEAYDLRAMGFKIL